MAGVMGTVFDLDSPTTVSGFARRRPGPVRKFVGAVAGSGALVLRWESPRNGTQVSGYRIERTPDGHTYETVGEADNGFFVVRPVPGESWFYRVTAFNSCGTGDYKWVCFFRRGDQFIRGGHNRPHLLHHIPVRPGLQVTVCDMD